MKGDLNRWWRAGLPLVAPIVRAVFHLRIEGISNVPASGSAILAFNHQSVLDGPVLAIVVGRRRSRATRFLIAAEIFRVPLIGWIIRRFDQIPISRGEGDSSALEEAIATVRRGGLAAIAPEGRVNEDPVRGMQRVRTGLARVALPTGAPVIPVGIWGTYERWPKRGPNYRELLRRPAAGLAFGSPIFPAGDPGSQDDIDGFTARVALELELRVERARALARDRSDGRERASPN